MTKAEVDEVIAARPFAAKLIDDEKRRGHDWLRIGQSAARFFAERA
jgi:hypothetical protein